MITFLDKQQALLSISDGRASSVIDYFRNPMRLRTPKRLNSLQRYGEFSDSPRLLGIFMIFSFPPHPLYLSYFSLLQCALILVPYRRYIAVLAVV